MSCEYQSQAAEISEFVDEEYEGALATLKKFGLYDPESSGEDDKAPPSLANVKSLLAEQLTGEQLEVVEQMQKPVLQLIPVISGERYLEALNSFKPIKVPTKEPKILREQKNANVSVWIKDALKRADERDGVSNNKIVGWKVAITEGIEAPAVFEGDDLGQTLSERLEWFDQEYGSKGVSGADIKRYILLQMRGLAKDNPQPLDDIWGEQGTMIMEERGKILVKVWGKEANGSDSKWVKLDKSRLRDDLWGKIESIWTMLNGEPVHDDMVVGGDWSSVSRCFVLDELHISRQYYYARFRTSVVFDATRA